MSEKKLASDYFMEGLNCAESVIKAYNEEFGTDIPIRVASGLGGGCAVGNLCGAVNGACICASFAKGRDDINKKTQQKLIQKIMQNNRTLWNCRM
ncbi:MAG: C-GCAxxG-C-C family (seleno)protein [Intestinibacter bartlettii]